MSPGVWDALTLVAALMFMVGYFYFYVSGVHFEDHALSRSSALAFLLCGGVAVWMLVRIL